MTTKWKKAGLAVLILATLGYVKLAFFSAPEYSDIGSEEPQNEQVLEKQYEKAAAKIEKTYVNVYFIGQNDEKEEVYKIEKRSYNSKKDGTKINFAIKRLLKGPSKKEKAHGIYSEFSQGTKLLSFKETKDKVIINLSEDFEQGGGTDGLYKRIYQLIKTANENTDKDVYLYINGKQADVLGGEGIMINQPLTSKSLDE